MALTSDLRSSVENYLDVYNRGVLPIVQAGHPVLRQPSTFYDDQLGDLLPAFVEAMRLTMIDAPGVGLAAPQIGVGLAIVVVQDPGVSDAGTAEVRERAPLDFRVLINPSYEAVGSERRSFYEGCLSVAGYQAVVARHRQVRLTGQDETGRELDEVLTGWPARIIQHETDHLRGQLYLDHAEMRSLSSNENLAALWSHTPGPREAAQRLTFPLA
jgi:peptide deformylase